MTEILGSVSNTYWDSILDYILLHILLYILDYFAESSESFAASQLLKELKDQCSAKQTAFYEYFNRVKQARTRELAL